MGKTIITETEINARANAEKIAASVVETPAAVETPTPKPAPTLRERGEAYAQAAKPAVGYAKWVVLLIGVVLFIGMFLSITEHADNTSKFAQKSTLGRIFTPPPVMATPMNKSSLGLLK